MACLLRLWPPYRGRKTNYGDNQSHYNKLNAVFTLADDCRRPELFHPQRIDLLKLVDSGFADASMSGARVGETGQMQLLPGNYLKYGIEGDGNSDGKVDIKHSVPDAIMTTAHILKELD